MPTGTKISQLDDGLDLQATDILPVARGTVNKGIKGSVFVTQSQLNGAIATSNTNLGHQTTTTSVIVSSSTGTSTTLPAASLNFAGVMTADDKQKLESAITSVPAAVATNLGNTPSVDSIVVSSSTGTSTTLLSASTTAAGLMTAADRIKLDSAITSVPPGAVTNLGNTPSANNITVTSSTGSSTILPAATTSTAGVMTAADRTLLNQYSGIQTFVTSGYGGSIIENYNGGFKIVKSTIYGGGLSKSSGVTTAVYDLTSFGIPLPPVGSTEQEMGVARSVTLKVKGLITQIRTGTGSGVFRFGGAAIEETVVITREANYAPNQILVNNVANTIMPINTVLYNSAVTTAPATGFMSIQGGDNRKLQLTFHAATNVDSGGVGNQLFYSTRHIAHLEAYVPNNAIFYP